MKVLLIQSPSYEYEIGDRLTTIPFSLPPLGLLYLAYPMAEAGFEVEILDLAVESIEKEEFGRKIIHADYIGISIYTQSLLNAKKLIKFIRNIKEDAYILCGGPHCNAVKEYIDTVDLIAIGEAEAYIADILIRIAEKKTLSDIPGLIYRVNGEIVRNNGVMAVQDLDQSRYSLNLVRGKHYGSLFGAKGVDIMGVLTSRGCPFRCSFCSHRGILEYRERSINNVLLELEDLVNQGYKYFIFADDVFLLNKQRVLALMAGIIRKNLNIRIVLQSRADSDDDEYYGKLRQAGVVMIMLGIESANQDVLDFYDKKISVVKIREAVECINRAGILSFGFFIMGAPMETRDHFANNLKFVNASKLDYVHAGVLKYRQGTPLWERCVKTGIIPEDVPEYVADERLSNFSYEELSNAQRKFIRQVYLDIGRISRMLYKIWRAGELRVALKIIAGAKFKFLEHIQNPAGKLLFL